MIYESHWVGYFNYLWGYRDRLNSREPQFAFLSNAQNPLDSIIGDVIGRIEDRLFIVEFKMSRDGIVAETSGAKQKQDRAKLIAHFATDRGKKTCLPLSHAGHFAAYPESGDICFEAYAGAANGDLTPKKHPCTGAYPDISTFEKFYAQMSKPHASLCTESSGSKLVFHRGLGLTDQGMETYLECMIGDAVGGDAGDGTKMKKNVLDILFVRVSPEYGFQTALATIRGLKKAYQARIKPVPDPATQNSGSAPRSSC